MFSGKVLLLSSLLCATSAAADIPRREVAGANLPNAQYAQNHAGRMDTDGILSPGEVRNPNINYDRAQREGERAGDARVENPDNDSAADEERYDRRREDRRSYDHDRRDREDDGNDNGYNNSDRNW